ncbi:BioY family transporter [Xaviernesmea oryzae]|uniref:Biotin transporter n=1 Tax=Xaviernesmea oryzae TaxID=464029 RepID=A0A1Q9ATD3_9HYPH|nr:biotin transporter BioY [Xaviernesmea oryzae]OLP58683.1 BioY family transporter [Xaviernesmea oryzae]SEK67733.1 biotin transport system substrate-specific component [Xaviernesmea oryzae]
MSSRDLVLIALFAALVAVLGMIPPVTIGFLPVPITAQSMGVMLAGCILGARRGALAFLLLILMVAIGLPVLSGGRGGLAILAGPTAGYIFGWVAGAFVTGLLAERMVRESQNGPRQILGFALAALVGGIGVVYLFGTLWLAYAKGIALPAVLIGQLPFLAGDLLKVAIAALAARSVMVGYPLLPQRG